MKRIFFTTVILALLFLCNGVARGQNNEYPPYDFTSVNADGNMLYYRITSSEAPFTVAVTRCHDSIFHELPVPQYEYQIGQPGFAYPVYDYDSLITIPSNVTYNGVSYTVTSIDNEAFYEQKGLHTVILPPTVTTINNSAFYMSSLEHIEMPNVTHILYGAFCNSELSSVDIPDCITVIEKMAFAGNPFTTVTVPSSITVIEEYVFAWCTELTQVYLPEHLDSIKDCAFYGTSSLKKIIIPSEVTYIGYFAFEGSYDPTFGLGLDTLIMQGVTPPEVDFNAFSRDHNLHVLVPCHTTETYQTDQNWSYYANYMVYHEDCTGVEEYETGNFNVYPNPVGETLHVTIMDGEIGQIEMFDMFGRAIRNSEFKIQNSNTQHFTIDMSAVPSGVYVLRVTLTDGAVRTVKVVKD